MPIPWLALLFIGAWESFDIVKQQLYKSQIKKAIRPMFDEDKRLLAGSGRYAESGISISVTPIPAGAEGDRRYHVEVYDAADRYPKHCFKYDARMDSLRYWKPHQEAGWGL